MSKTQIYVIAIAVALLMTAFASANIIRIEGESSIGSTDLNTLGLTSGTPIDYRFDVDLGITEDDSPHTPDISRFKNAGLTGYIKVGDLIEIFLTSGDTGVANAPDDPGLNVNDGALISFNIEDITTRSLDENNNILIDNFVSSVLLQYVGPKDAVNSTSPAAFRELAERAGDGGSFGGLIAVDFNSTNNARFTVPVPGGPYSVSDVPTPTAALTMICLGLPLLSRRTKSI